MAHRIEKTWTEEDIAILKRMDAAKAKTEVIAKQLKRGVKSVRAKIRRIGLAEKASPLWGDADRRRLMELKAQGLRGPALYEHFPGRTSGAVLSQIRDLQIKMGRGKWVMPEQVEPEPPPVVEDIAVPLWSPPPPTKWPAPVITPASRCQFPLWPHHVGVPRPALFCDKPSYRHSLCQEHFRECYEELRHEPKSAVRYLDDAVA